MILALTISLCASLFLAWITILYIWWRNEKQQALTPIEAKDFDKTIKTLVRGIRRTWYNIVRYADKGIVWFITKIASLFFIFFPKAAHAFTSKDELTGLEHGPSSFYLMSISEEAKKKQKKHRV